MSKIKTIGPWFLFLQVGREIDVSPLVQALQGIRQTRPFPEMVAAIKTIKSEGLKTALLTNNWFTDEQKTQSLIPLDTALFDVVRHFV